MQSILFIFVIVVSVSFVIYIGIRHVTKLINMSQRNVRLILDSTSEGIIELDMEYRIVFANKASLSILGAT